MLDEAWAILSALLDDFSSIDSIEVTTLISANYAARLNDRVHWSTADTAASRDDLFVDLAKSSDATLIVAPEFEGILLSLAKRVEINGLNLLSPDSSFIEIASDKQTTCERLHQAEVPTPRGRVVVKGERIPHDFSSPYVVKPIDGCGSQGVLFFDKESTVPNGYPVYRFEEYHAGQPASAIVLCSEETLVTFPPCTQSIAEGNVLGYHGGQFPLKENQAIRAIHLAENAIRAFPSTNGLVGVDMILGQDEDGSDDLVIEINPRITTSYVGLRAATDANLMEFMLDQFSEKCPEAPQFKRTVSWSPDGRITLL